MLQVCHYDYYRLGENYPIHLCRILTIGTGTPYILPWQKFGHKSHFDLDIWSGKSAARILSIYGMDVRDSNSIVVTTAEAILKPKFYFFVFPLFATKSNWESYQLSPSIAKKSGTLSFHPSLTDMKTEKCS